MTQITRIGIDTSKAVFTLHCVDHTGRTVQRINLRRGQLVGFLRKLPPTEIALETCGSAHHWVRELTALGHQPRLSALTACRCIGPLCGPIPPQYVKPFVKRAKNDRADAEAISEAAAPPTMPSVAIKTVDQQASAMILKHRAMLVAQRTQAVNALRGPAAEFGVVAAKGTAQVAARLEKLAAEPAVSAVARAMFEQMGEHIAALGQRMATLDEQLLALHRDDPISQLLAEVPGIGPVTAITVALTVEPGNFTSGRHFAAWLGLTAKQHATGGKQRLGRISKAGNERLRQLRVVGAPAIIRCAKPGSRSASAGLLQLLERQPRKRAAVALANKMARIVWAMMVRGEAYRRQPPVA